MKDCSADHAVRIFRRKTLPAIALVLFCLVAIAAHNACAQSRPDIGTFDINKVRNAASSDTALTADSAAASAVPARAGAKENWSLVILRIALYLGITIVAIFFVVWGIKKAGLAGRSRLGAGSMDVLEALPLGPNKSIALVRVVDKVYLIGQTQTQISVLDTVEGQKAIELISSSKGVVSMSQFKDVFSSFMDRFKAK